MDRRGFGPWPRTSQLCNSVGMTDYTPTPQYTAALEEFNRTKQAHEEATKALRAATGEELKTSGIASKAFKPLSPWSEETLRVIAREAGVPLLKAPPKRKPRTRKTAGGTTSG